MEQHDGTRISNNIYVGIIDNLPDNLEKTLTPIEPIEVRKNTIIWNTRDFSPGVWIWEAH